MPTNFVFGNAGATLVGVDTRQLGFFDQDAARFRAFVARDDAPTLEHVDQAAGSGIADPEAALQEARRGCLGCDDDLDRALEQRVLVGIELRILAVLLRRRLGRLEQALVELLLPLRAALLDDQRDLLLGHERALEALEARRPQRLEEHVALAEQALGARLVED